MMMITTKLNFSEENRHTQKKKKKKKKIYKEGV